MFTTRYCVIQLLLPRFFHVQFLYCRKYSEVALIFLQALYDVVCILLIFFAIWQINIIFIRVFLKSWEKGDDSVHDKHAPCFHTVIKTRVEVWEPNEKLMWEHEPVGRVIPRYFEFSQTSTRVSVTYRYGREKIFFIHEKMFLFPL